MTEIKTHFEDGRKIHRVYDTPWMREELMSEFVAFLDDDVIVEQVERATISGSNQTVVRARLLIGMLALEKIRLEREKR